MNTIPKFVAGAPLTLLALATLSASCSEAPEEVAEEEEEVAVAMAEDGDWIRLDGTIFATGPSTFELDYGEDTITVEADDWDLTQEGLALVPGDRVSVTGRVDRDVFANTALEASAIYLHNLDAVFYANAADEEEFGLAAIPTRPATEGADYTGWVTGSSEDGFTLGSGPTLINVDTSGLGTSLAKDGIASGDRVYVWGDFELSKEGQSTLAAEGLVELVNGSAGNSSGDQGVQTGTT